MIDGKYLIFVKEPAKGSFTENTTVYINPKEYWDEFRCQADYLKEDQQSELGPVLEDIGLVPISECIFECGILITTEDLKEILFEEGFIEDISFNEFMHDTLVIDDDDVIIEDEYDMFEEDF